MKLNTAHLLSLYIERVYPVIPIADNTLLVAENTKLNRFRMKLLKLFFRLLLPSPIAVIQIPPPEPDSTDLALLRRLGVQPFPERGEKGIEGSKNPEALQ